MLFLFLCLSCPSHSGVTYNRLEDYRRINLPVLERLLYTHLFIFFFIFTHVASGMAWRFYTFATFCIFVLPFLLIWFFTDIIALLPWCLLSYRWCTWEAMANAVLSLSFAFVMLQSIFYGLDDCTRIYYLH